jgi:hypothetical protein
MEHNQNNMSQDILAKKASLTAGIIGAVMVVLVCFGAALAFSNPAGAKAGQQSPEAAVQINVQADGS